MGNNNKDNREYIQHILGSEACLEYVLYASPSQVIDPDDNDPSLERHYILEILENNAPVSYNFGIKTSPTQAILEFGKNPIIFENYSSFVSNPRVTHTRCSFQNDEKIVQSFITDFVPQILGTRTRDSLLQKMTAIVDEHCNLLFSEIEKYSKNIFTDAGLLQSTLKQFNKERR